MNSEIQYLDFSSIDLDKNIDAKIKVNHVLLI